MHQSEILVPALQSQWFMMHISMMVLGYAALLCGSLLSVALLVITFRQDIRILSKKNHFKKKAFSFDEIQYITKGNNVLQSTSFLFVRNYYKAQLIQQLDRWSYRVISLGFLFLTIGILLGAVWANEAWGSYWNWDQKKLGHLLLGRYSRFIYILEQIEISKSQIPHLSLLWALIIWICYFGVNLSGIGLHNYGSSTLT